MIFTSRFLRTAFCIGVLVGGSGCSDWMASRRCRAAMGMQAAAEEAFRKGDDAQSKTLYQQALQFCQKAETGSKQAPIKEKAKQTAENCQRHLAMFGTPSQAGDVLLSCLSKTLDEMEQYVDFSSVAPAVIVREGKPSNTPEDMAKLHALFGFFLTNLMSSDNPFAVATCKVQDEELKGSQALCHITCAFAGVESTLTLSLSRSSGGRWRLRDFIIQGLGISCMSAFRDAVVVMESKVPFDVLAQGDKEIIRELEREYHKIAEKAPEEVIYQSAQGRQVQLTEDSDLLDDAQQVVRRARSGEVFLVKTEVMKEDTVLWLEVPQDPTKPEGPQTWVKKSSTRTIPREDEEVWGF